MDPEQLQGLLNQLLAGGTGPLARIGEIKPIAGNAPDIAAMPKGGGVGAALAAGGGGGDDEGGIIDWMKGKLGIGQEEPTVDPIGAWMKGQGQVFGPPAAVAPAAPLAHPVSPTPAYAPEFPQKDADLLPLPPMPGPAYDPLGSVSSIPPKARIAGMDERTWAMMTDDEKAFWLRVQR